MKRMDFQFRTFNVQSLLFPSPPQLGKVRNYIKEAKIEKRDN